LLLGLAGPGGTDDVRAEGWLLRFGAESEELREALASLTEWLANGHPPWAAYRALMACRLVALDKQPGVRPVGIGEIWRRLMAKCVIAVAGSQATAACGNLNLCAGLPAGIEGAVHAVEEAWRRSEPPKVAPPPRAPAPLEEPGGIGVAAPGVDMDGASAPADAAETEAQEQAPGEAVLLVDARNGFNELGRKAMLWTVRHRWAAGARFAFNCYRHQAQLVMRSPGSEATVLRSMEGVTQGDPLSMYLYGLALLPLSESLRRAVPAVRQLWYADDLAMVGEAAAIATCMRTLQDLGPKYGYFPEPEKSILVCRPETREAAAAALGADLTCSMVDGARYLGGFVGSDATRSEWLGTQVAAWSASVGDLARVATRYPQTAYAGLAMSLQAEWRYLQKVVAGCGADMAPIEAAVANEFLPALLGAPRADCPTRGRTALSVKCAGIGVPDPTTTAADAFRASERCTAPLTQSLLDGTPLDVDEYAADAARARRDSRVSRHSGDVEALGVLTAAASAAARRKIQRLTETGAWLSTVPNQMNGTELSAEEFRDSLRLRFDLAPQALPAKCDACDCKFDVAHALSCKKGGLIARRHNDVKAEWHHLCAQALSRGAVSDEPNLISQTAPQETASAKAAPLELRGDVKVANFWARGKCTIFDVRVTDTDAVSYRRMDPLKVLSRQEKEKKGKYLAVCLEKRMSFTPLVFSVDGLKGAEAAAAGRRLSALLATKWKRPFSQVCGMVNSRLSIALVRSTSACLRTARDPLSKPTHAEWDCGAGLALYRLAR